jgi:hypothetical protein
MLSGLLFAAFGIAMVVAATNYPIGTAAEMGAGYFPLGLGILVALIGFTLMIREIRKPSVEALPIQWKVKPLFLILASIVVFAFLIERAGVVLIAMTFIARLAEPNWRWLDVTMLTIVLIALALGIFVYGLQIPLQIGFW